MQKITPFLWFNDNLEEAMNFYISIFKNAKVDWTRNYGPEGPGKEGSLMTATFELEGQKFMGINGGPVFQFTPAVSFFVNCKTQEEVDELWEKLSEGGEKVQCGWLKDKFGLSWQIVPAIMSEILNSSDKEASGRAMRAMMKMTKLDGNVLKKAYDGELETV
jgi:predicted 3-demethylubiquinone-9 3-methyltransferase (glyoxalase superfamily)